MAIPTIDQVEESGKNMDTITEFVKSDNDTLVDQYGDTRNTLKSVETAIRNAGGVPLGDGQWGIGKTYTAYDQVLYFNSVPYKPLNVPYTTQGADPTQSPDLENVQPYSDISSGNIDLYLDPLKADVSSNTESIEDNTGDISLLSGTVSVLEQGQEDNTNSISLLQQGQSDNTSRITSNETAIDALQQGQGAGVYGYETKALLDADLTPDDQSIAYVTNDTTAVNNGTYRKDGASGSGSWVQSSDDLASSAYQKASENETLLDDAGITATGGTNDDGHYPYSVTDESGQMALGVKADGTTTIGGGDVETTESHGYVFSLTDENKQVALGVTDIGSTTIGKAEFTEKISSNRDGDKYAFSLSDDNGQVALGVFDDGTVVVGGSKLSTDRNLRNQQYKDQVNALIRRGKGLRFCVVGDSVSTVGVRAQEESDQKDPWSIGVNMAVYGLMQSSLRFQQFTQERPQSNSSIVSHAVLDNQAPVTTLTHELYQSDIVDPNNLLSVYFLGATREDAAQVEVRVYTGETLVLFDTYQLDTYIPSELTEDIGSPTPTDIGYQINGKSFALPITYEKITVEIDTPVALSREGQPVSTTANARILGTSLGEPLVFKNYAVSGAALRGRDTNGTTTDGMFDRAMAFNPDVLYLALGQNDSNTSPFPDADTPEGQADFKSKLISRCKSFISQNPRIVIVLVSPCAWDGAVNSANTPYANIIKSVAYDLGLLYLDMQTLFNLNSLEGADQIGRNYAPYLSGGYDVFDISNDGIHPTGVGQALISESLSILLGTKKFSPINEL
jgi:lysophospholipase L1-like esterase